MKSTVIPLMLSTKSSLYPSIVELFLATVSGFVSQSFPSATETTLPGLGVAGRVRVQEPPVVSATIWSPATAVYVVVFTVQPDPPPPPDAP